MISIDESKKLIKFRPFGLPSFKKIAKLYDIKPGDNILIWCDTGDKKSKNSPRLGKTFYKKFSEMGCNVSIIVEKERAYLGPASQKTQRAVKSLSKGGVFVSVGSAGRGYIVERGKHTLIRTLMNKKKFKMIAIGGLSSVKPMDMSTFFESFDHNQREINSIHRRLRIFFKGTKKIKISCPLGTELEMKLGNREIISNDGNWRAYSTNYPVGEVYTTPVENSANGVAFISSVKIIGKTILPKKPIKFVFKKGILIKTSSATINKNLQKAAYFNRKKMVKNASKASRTIAEFAIGTNRKAKIIGAMICDEKTLGTCHFAIGNNKHMGGKTYCFGHFDNVIASPTVWFDGIKIIENGKLLI